MSIKSKAQLVVILTNNLPDGASGATTVDAFRVTFWWLTAAALAALLGAGWLVREQRRTAPFIPVHESKENLV